MLIANTKTLHLPDIMEELVHRYLLLEDIVEWLGQRQKRAIKPNGPWEGIAEFTLENIQPMF